MEIEKKDLILLDAKLVNQVSVRAFRAELANGHGLVAYAGVDSQRVPAVGEMVKVVLSPYDMSAGRIVFGDVK